MSSINKKRFAKITAGVLSLILAVSGGQVSVGAAQDQSVVGIEFVGNLVVRFWSNYPEAALESGFQDELVHSVYLSPGEIVGFENMPEDVLPPPDFGFRGWFLNRNGTDEFDPEQPINRVTDVYADWFVPQEEPPPPPPPLPDDDDDPPPPEEPGEPGDGDSPPTEPDEPGDGGGSPPPPPDLEEPGDDDETPPADEDEDEDDSGGNGGTPPPPGEPPPPSEGEPPEEPSPPSEEESPGEPSSPGEVGLGDPGEPAPLTVLAETFDDILEETIETIEYEADEITTETDYDPLELEEEPEEEEELTALEDPPVPLAPNDPSEPYTIQIGNLQIPLAAPPGFNAWALMNLILSILGVALAIVTIKRYRTQRKIEQDEEDAIKEQLLMREGIIADEETGVTAAMSEAEATTLAASETGDEIDKRKQTGLVWPVGVGIVSVAAIILFVLTQDMNNPWVLLDRWTIAHGIMFTAKIAAYYMMFKKQNKDQDGESPEDTDDLALA